MKRRLSLLVALAASVAAIVLIALWRETVPGTVPQMPGSPPPATQSTKPRITTVRPVDSDARESPALRVRVTTTMIVSERSVPLPDVDVAAVGGTPTDTAEGRRNPKRASASSRADGVAELDLPAAGTWRLTAVHPGYFGATQLFEFPSPGADYRVEMQLTPFAVLEGHVADQNGDPVAGAIVKVDGPPGAMRMPGPLHDRDHGTDPSRGKTGQDGAFRLAPVASDTKLSLTATARAGTASVDLEPLAAGETRSVSLRFPPRTDLAGRVGGDAKLGPATVECWRHENGDPTRLGLEQRATTADDGTFVFENVAPGNKTLVAVRGRGTETEVAVKFAEAKAGLRNDAGVLEPSGTTMRLIAVLEGGADRQRAIKLILRPVTPTVPHTVYPMTLKIPSETEVTIRGLPPGRLMAEGIVCSVTDADSPDPDFDVAQIDSEIEDGRRLEVVVPRSNRSSLGGVAARIEPPPGTTVAELRAQVLVVKDGFVQFASQGDTSACETFALGGQPPGDYQVIAVTGSWTSDPVDLRLEAGKASSAVVNRWNRAATVSGSAVDRGGRPLTGADVYVEQSCDGPGRPRVTTVLSTVVAADGTFRFDAVPRLKRLYLRVASATGSSSPVPVDADHGADGIKIVGVK